MAGDSKRHIDQPTMGAADTVRVVDKEVKRLGKGFRRIFEDVKLKNKTDRYIRRMEAAISVLYVPFEKKEDLWNEIRNGLVEDQRNGNLTTAKMNEKMEIVNEDILGRMSEMVELAKQYIDAMVKLSPHHRLSSRALMKMVKSAHVNIVRFTALMMEDRSRFGGLKKAVKWALGMQSTDEGGTRTAEASKPEAFKELIKQFDENRHNERFVRYAWFILGVVNTATKVEFSKTYLAGKSSRSAMAFLEDGNKRGVFSPGEMESILESIGKMDAVSDKFEGKRKQYETLWEVQNLFKQDVARLDKKTYQGGMGNNGHSLVENMLTGLNFVIEGGFAVAVGSLFGNVMVELFKGGSMHINAESLKKAFTKKYTLASGAIIAAKHFSTTNKHIPVTEGLFKSVNERKEEEKIALRERLKESNNSSWGKFFKKDDYSGVFAISKWIDMFRDSDGKVAQDRLKFKDFKAYIKEESSGLMAMLNKTSGDQREFKDICNAIDEFKIGGDKVQAIRRFKDEINKADHA